MDSLPSLIAVLLAVGAIVFLSVRLGFAGTPRLQGSGEIAGLLEGLPGGFDCERSAFCASASGALAMDGDGRICLIAPHGAHFLARLVSAQTAAERDGDRLTVRDGKLVARLELGSEAEFWHDALRRAAEACPKARA